MHQPPHRTRTITRVAAAWLIAFAAATGTAQPTRGSACPGPDEIAVTLARSGQLMDQSRYTDAIAQLEPSATRHCDPRIVLLLAGAYEGSGDLAQAQITLEQALTAWPGDTGISTSLARAYLAGGNTDKAVKALANFRVSASTPQQELQEATLVYIAGHHLESAQTIADTLERRYPSLRSLLLLANVLQLQGRYKDVNHLLEEKRQTYGNAAPFLITAAESEYDAMLYDRARKDLEQAVVLTPDIYQAHFLLGNVLLAQKMPDQSAAEYRIAIRLAPRQPRSYYQLSLIARQHQDDDAEQQLLTQALTADERYEPAYTELGRILMDQHKYSEAVEKLNRAIAYNARTEQAYFLLSRAYASLGDHEKSTEMANLYTKVRSENRKSFVDDRPGQLGTASSPDVK